MDTYGRTLSLLCDGATGPLPVPKVFQELGQSIGTRAALSEILLNLPLKSHGVYNQVAHQFAQDNLKKDHSLGRLISQL